MFKNVCTVVVTVLWPLSPVQDWAAVHDQQTQPRAERARRGRRGGAERAV